MALQFVMAGKTKPVLNVAFPMASGTKRDFTVLDNVEVHKIYHFVILLLNQLHPSGSKFGAMTLFGKFDR